MEVDEIDETLIRLVYVECSPQNGSSYGENVSASFQGGIAMEPLKPYSFTEQMFELKLKELKAAMTRAKMAKAADEIGLTAGMSGHIPDSICNDLMKLLIDMLFSGDVPPAWQTLFNMLPKTLKPRTTTDVRPIASIRLLYKIFTYMM